MKETDTHSNIMGGSDLVINKNKNIGMLFIFVFSSVSELTILWKCIEMYEDVNIR